MDRTVARVGKLCDGQSSREGSFMSGQKGDGGREDLFSVDRTVADKVDVNI
jgi:hypothetical protein